MSRSGRNGVRAAPEWRWGLPHRTTMEARQLRTMLRTDDPEGFERFEECLGQDGWQLLARALNKVDEDGTTLHWLEYFPSYAIARLLDPEERMWHMKTFLNCGWPRVLHIWRMEWPEGGRTEYWLDGQRIVALLADASVLRNHLERVADGTVRAISRYSGNGRKATDVMDTLRREHVACEDAASLFRAMPAAMRESLEPLRPARAALEALPVECAFSLHDSLVDFGTRLDDNSAHRDEEVQAWWKSWSESGFDYRLNCLLDSFTPEFHVRALHCALDAAAGAFSPDDAQNIRALVKLGAVPGPSAYTGRGWWGDHMDINRTHADLVEFRDAYGRVLAALQAQQGH